MAVTRKPPGRFHHGDLRRALLDAVAEAVLALGPDGVSLRDCARRAGVAHSAATPHFGDKRGLLTAFAVEGFDRLRAAQEAAMAAAPAEPAAQLAACGRGYLAFARAQPGHFRLMFRTDLLAKDDPALQAAGEGAWCAMAQAVTLGTEALDPATRHARMVFAWCVVHGFASLAAEGGGALLAGDGPAEAAEAALLDRLVEACLAPEARDHVP